MRSEADIRRAIKHLQDANREMRKGARVAVHQGDVVALLNSGVMDAFKWILEEASGFERVIELCDAVDVAAERARRN